MFAIVISEKGGAERRETFDKHEINVGRVQGNDLMLPKGNVSKKHARLLFRDGRVIVTDLRSTNGTYVNGRKIAQATILREGDKIYVGDFVLRVELSASTQGTSAIGAGAAPATLPLVPASRQSFTFEQEYTARHEGLAASPTEGADLATGRHSQPDAPDTGVGVPRSPAPSLPDSSVSTPQMRPSQVPPSLVPRVGHSQTGATQGGPRATTRLLALSALIEKVGDGIDLTPLNRGAEPDQVLAHRIERLVREKAKGLRDEGNLASDVDTDDLIHDTLRELFGLGAIEPLLEDDDVSEIRVFGHASVTAVRGNDFVEMDPPFSSEGALYRAIVRLCRQSPTPLASGETVVERYIARGLLVNAVLPPTSQYGHALVIKKRRRAETGLDDLVRSGTISRAMATFLRACVATRVNVLVVGPADATSTILSALLSVSQPTDRVVTLQPIDELWGMDPEPVALRLSDAPGEVAKVVRAAAKLRPERLVVSPMVGQAASAVASVIAEGCEGVLGAVAAPSLRHAFDRLVSDLMAARPGYSPDAARSSVATSFELAIEIAQLRDGRRRVMRIAEIQVSDGALVGRDVFTFVVERTALGGTVEGSFVATGHVPRIAEDLGTRGNPLDSAIFRR